MTSMQSAGILLFRVRDERLQMLLAHPGGPFWSDKDEGAWSIPKGMFDNDETPLEAAKRELFEETGIKANGEFIDLGSIRLPSRKIVFIWAIRSDWDAKKIISNKFSLEWPKGSGILREFPEVDRAEWFDVKTARKKIQKGQAEFIDRLIKIAEIDEPVGRLSSEPS
ncbi:MAG: NUDIX domain-containing protein [Methanothrix sp.]|nr:NUDIX domain-containing protein [Methanothrix sp.]